jgi:RNA-directed DNA polymerase
LQEKLENRFHEEKQMTAMVTPLTGAPSDFVNWDAIDWPTVVEQVKRLQMRIAKATREGRQSKAKALQWLLTHSFYAKLLAVKRVTQSQGAKTPGVDGVVWSTPRQKFEAARALRRKGYHSQPLRRIYIPKKNGQKRPLSIPTLHCRAQQALYLLGLEPVTEVKADSCAYGFRPKRSTADAIAHCFNVLSRKTSATYVLEGDIKACFDTIEHQWIESNIALDRKVLTQWLKAGYIDRGGQEIHPTEEGVPQGGIISPCITVGTLSGLAQAAKAVTKSHDKVHVISYADDFIITGTTKEVLEKQVQPAIEAFLHERGLTLSLEKTKITHIEEGFDFLGFNVRKYDNKLLIKPTKGNVISFLNSIRELIKSQATAKTENLIRLINPKLRGWANYYHHVVSKRTFSYVNSEVFRALWRWAKRRHPNKGLRWIKRKYLCAIGLRNWVFSSHIKDKHGEYQSLELFNVASVRIKRHVKIKSEATPYDPRYADYFKERSRKQNWGRKQTYR